jgi:hypothetical protein
MPVGATCSVAVASVRPRRWPMGMVVAMRRLARRNNSSNSNHHNHHHHKHSNGNNLDNNVEVQGMVPKTVSPNADSARWRGIERGRMTFIMLVGRANACLVSFCYPNDHHCALFSSFYSFLSLSVIASLVLRIALYITMSRLHRFPPPPLPLFDSCLFSWLWWCYSCVAFIFISRSAFLSHYRRLFVS